MNIIYGHYILFLFQGHISLNESELEQPFYSHNWAQITEPAVQCRCNFTAEFSNSQIRLFHEVDEYYGVDHDPNGPIAVENDAHVEVPQSSLHFSDTDLSSLRQTVDPCAPSDNHAINLYEQTLDIILNL